MTIRRALLAILSALGLPAIVSCHRDAAPLPPEILYGQQECEQCRMIISDERYAAGIVLELAKGESAAFAFDDVNCMFNFEQEHAPKPILARYVHDCATGRWLDAASAHFLLSDRLQTPMASGVAAAADRQSLEMLQRDNGGRLLDFTTLRARFMSPATDRKGATP